MSQSYLKASVNGLNGSGKTGTVVRLACGLALEYCGGAPVVVADSEERWRFQKVTIFDVEKIKLIIVPGQTLVGVQKSFKIAKEEGAGVWVADQLTTPWMEGIREFSYSNGDLPFDRRQQLMNQWEPVISDFRYSPFHCIGIGRLGYNWSNVEDENGNMKLVQGDSKFNAGGGNNFGYEADLELEMRRRKQLISIAKKILRGGRTKASVEHICDVVKDAASGIINGQQFTFESAQGLYKQGDYKEVLNAFRPYIEFMRKVDVPVQPKGSSGELIVAGQTPWMKDQRERKALLEELDALMEQCFGGKTSTQGKMFRNLTLEYLNGYISVSRMEEDLPTVDIERNVLVMKAVRRRVENQEMPTNRDSLIELVKLCVNELLHPEVKNMTLLEVMGRKSLASVDPPEDGFPAEEAPRKSNGKTRVA